MKKPLILILAVAMVAGSFISAEAEQWSFFGFTGKTTDVAGFSEKPFTTVLSAKSEDPMGGFSGSDLTSFVPIRLEQLVVSLVDVTQDENPFVIDKSPVISQFHLDTGIQAESRLTNSQSLFVDKLFGDNASSFEVASSVIFVGVGIDFKSGYLKGKAFIGRPMETLTNRLYNTNAAGSMKNRGLNTDAVGFEASAGYKLNDKIALGAGFGRMNDKNQETDQTEEVYAVYAQAVLAIAPGIHVIPEVGQIERIKEEPVSEKKDESFYAGARWEINF